MNQTENMRVKLVQTSSEAQQAELKALREKVEQLLLVKAEAENLGLSFNEPDKFGRIIGFNHRAEKAEIQLALAEDEIERMRTNSDLLRQGGEMVGEVVRNATGQIHMLGSDGNCFDMSKFVGVKLYTRPQPTIPPGYVVVPVEPTAAMHGAGDGVSGKCWMGGKVWRAMLASAPAIQPQAAVPIGEQDAAVLAMGYESGIGVTTSDGAFEITLRYDSNDTGEAAMGFITNLIDAAILATLPKH